MSLLRISGLSPRPGAESHGRLVSRCECLVAADQLASDTPVGCARALALTVISSGNAEVVHRDGEVKKKYRKKAMGWNGEREEEKEREVRTERRTDVARIAKGSSLTPPSLSPSPPPPSTPLSRRSYCTRRQQPGSSGEGKRSNLYRLFSDAPKYFRAMVAVW